MGYLNKDGNYYSKSWIQMLNIEDQKVKVKWSIHKNQKGKEDGINSLYNESKSFNLSENQLNSFKEILFKAFKDQIIVNEITIPIVYNREEELSEEEAEEGYTHKIKVTYKAYSNQSDLDKGNFTLKKEYLKLSDSQVKTLWSIIYETANTSLFKEDFGFTKA